MKTKIAKSLFWMFLLTLLVGGLSTNALAGGGPAPLPGPGGKVAKASGASTNN